MTSTLLLGIDIGWSEKKRSSAVAAIDPLNVISWPDRAVTYDRAISCSCFRFSEVIKFLASVQTATANYEQIVAVFDGPLGPYQRPRENRYVDGAFRRGEFNRRMQPVDVSTDDGQVYVSATYDAITALVPDFTPWMGDPLDQRVVIAETNPTVGLALMNRKYPPEQLPSRSRPLVPPSSGRSPKPIRAKSDFYWKTGGAFRCSQALGSESVRTETDHERVAGLYCLTVAASIAYGRFCVCGDATDGVYVFPAEIHPDWCQDIEGVGVVAGQLLRAEGGEDPTDFSLWTRATTASSRTPTREATVNPEREDEVEVELACKGDVDYLLLKDNGGVWEAHNDWLVGMEEPVVAVSRITGERLQLTRAERDGQWRCQPSTKSIAADHGVDVPHLSAKKCVSIPIDLVD
ncbi:MAG: hypothetical protein KDB14_29050 [Planctomycetales bacterium]|nr:hypothetical protein [Planctomycetales bacterium]